MPRTHDATDANDAIDVTDAAAASPASDATHANGAANASHARDAPPATPKAAGAPLRLTSQGLALLELLAFVYLQNRRPESAATLLEALLATGAANERACGALALAQLRIGRPDAALRTLERASLRTRIEPAFQLLRAQALGALHRPDEAAAAMAAFVDARRARATTPPHA